MGYTKITITVEDKLLKAYKKFCEENAIKLSTDTITYEEGFK